MTVVKVVAELSPKAAIAIAIAIANSKLLLAAVNDAAVVFL
ncbi:hypothetical protein TUM19329_13780 [Legionella antarctica]|uniref:Uncharacterized protein n=1 Tax=Legionella antarctica TaxID=2708020 RepID=A0A6F8T4D1_9GAMM|nr:hypothetical protein TUM19329_13780 [Legionella antarctica]